MEADPTRYHVKKAYTSPYPHPLIFRRGDAVELGREFADDPEWKDWVWCERADGPAAWVPKQHLDRTGGKATFKENYDARELSVSVGEALIVHEIVNGFGMAEKPDGTRGWVPMRNRPNAVRTSIRN